VWTLDPDISLDEVEARAVEHWPLVPALVTVGTTVDGAVLANLEHAGSLAVEGDPDAVRAVLGQMLVELTSQPWTDQMLDSLHAVGDPGAQHLAGVEVDHDPLAMAEKLDKAADRAVAQLNGAPSVAARRAVDGSAWLPQVVVAFADTDPEVGRCLVEAATPDRSGVAVVIAGAGADTRWRLTVDGTGMATLAGFAGDHPFQLALEVQAKAEVIDLLGEALSAAADPTDPSPGLDDPLVTETGSIEPGEVEVRLLGKMGVVGGPLRPELARRDGPLAVLAYLGSRPGPVTIHDLTAALWPPDSGKDHFGMPAPKTVHNVISQARSLIGVDADGEHRLRLAHGGYALADSVTTDWQRFQTLTHLARTGPSAEAAARYREALELVEGTPFAGSLDSQFFEWVSAEQLEHTITAAIVDAAEELARLALETGDHALVLWAVQRGVGIDPAREQLYQYWMHALGQTADTGQVTGVWERLCSALQKHIDPAQGPSPDSQAVYRTYVVRQDVHR
jgi:DNA-binding SARP family transcriptional activator